MVIMMDYYCVLRILLLLTPVICGVYTFPQTENQQPDDDPLDEHMLSLDDILQDGYSSNSDGYITGDAPCQCGVPVTRIFGGEDTTVNQYPWTALLYLVETANVKIPYCGGVLINDLYVLTASHCVDGMPQQKIEIALREQNISSAYRDATTVIRVGVDDVIQHPAYSRTTLDNDIALIRLNSRIPLQDNYIVTPICVPREDVTFSQGLSATVAGYGAVSEAGIPASNLQRADVRVLSNELCNGDPHLKGKISDNMLCADGPGKGPCKGDTGGPLMVKFKNTKGQILAGIASWSTTCDDPTRPAVYTRVPRYEAWIKANTYDADWCYN